MRKLLVVTIILALISLFCSCSVTESSITNYKSVNSENYSLFANDKEYIKTEFIKFSNGIEINLKLYGKILSVINTTYGINKIEVFKNNEMLQTLYVRDAISEWKKDDFDGLSRHHLKMEASNLWI